MGTICATVFEYLFSQFTLQCENSIFKCLHLVKHGQKCNLSVDKTLNRREKVCKKVPHVLKHFDPHHKYVCMHQCVAYSGREIECAKNRQ